MAYIVKILSFVSPFFVYISHQSLIYSRPFFDFAVSFSVIDESKLDRDLKVLREDARDFLVLIVWQTLDLWFGMLHPIPVTACRLQQQQKLLLKIWPKSTLKCSLMISDES